MEYRDRFITCDTDEIRIRWYYFPFGTKAIPYGSIRNVWRFDRSFLRGRLRLWGTSNPAYWASLDPVRPRKRGGLVIDKGGFVKVVITPEDADAVATVLEEKTGLHVRVDNRALLV